MNNYKIYQGNCLQVLKGMGEENIQCVVTSPPYYGLRDYGTMSWQGGDSTCNHTIISDLNSPKHTEKGRVTRGKRDSCLKCGAKRIDEQIGLEDNMEEYIERLVEVFREVRRVLKKDGTVWLNLGDSYNGSGGAGGDYNKGGLREEQPRYPGRNEIGLKRKDLMGVPWRVALALQADGWWLRQDIIWSKPNVMPESVTDRCTKAHEYVFLLSKSEKYFFNQKAIQEKSIGTTQTPRFGGTKYGDNSDPKYATKSGNPYIDTGSRNRRSVWTISTTPYKGAHFAVMPPELARLCVMAGSREGDIVFDPFCGSGTTGAVALGLERKFLGIELNAEYIVLAEKRIGTVFERMQNKLDLNWDDEDESD